MQEYSWTLTGFSRPPFEDRIVPYPACPALARPDYLAYTDYAYLPTPPGAVYGCATTAATGFGSQHLNASIPGGVATKYCCPPLHTPLPGASDNVFQPAHSSAHASHMEPCLPAYSPTCSDVTLQAAHCAGSPDQNGLENRRMFLFCIVSYLLWIMYYASLTLATDRYRSPMYASSGSNGLTTIGVSEVLPNNHSPVHTEPHVSYDCPKYKLTQERALPLVRWYEEHQDHPYPNRQEKLNLCQVTQLTYTQVSTSVA